MAELPPPPERIVLAHFIVSDDVERSARFYTEVLGGRLAFSGPGGLTYVQLANSWIIINVGGGPTDDKPTVTLETPPDPDRVSSFLNIRVADIHAVYAEWSARGAQFLTPPKQHQYEIRCYIRDPDGYLIEVGQTTDTSGDWVPAHWPRTWPARNPSRRRTGCSATSRRSMGTVREEKGDHPMRSDIKPGGVFPDYSLPDHTGTVRTLSELQGGDPLILTLARGQLLPQGAPAAPGAGGEPVQGGGGLHPDRHHRHRRPSHPAGVPGFGRRPMDVPLRPRPDGPARPRHPGVHRPRARPDDPPHARAQAGSGHPQRLQRLLVLGTPVVLRAVARPARRVERDPPRLGPEQAGPARGVGRRRLLVVPRMGQEEGSMPTSYES